MTRGTRPRASPSAQAFPGGAPALLLGSTSLHPGFFLHLSRPRLLLPTPLSSHIPPRFSPFVYTETQQLCQNLRLRGALLQATWPARHVLPTPHLDFPHQKKAFGGIEGAYYKAGSKKCSRNADNYFRYFSCPTAVPGSSILEISLFHDQFPALSLVLSVSLTSLSPRSPKTPFSGMIPETIFL